MKILFYRYGNICESDIIEAFRSLQIEVTEECSEITNKCISASERVDLLQKHVEKNVGDAPFLFVFSVNFFPAIAEFCHILKIPYVCWTVDCPVLELFSKSIQYDTNFIFMFDQAQYEYYRWQNLEHIYYLPLAANVKRWDKVRLAKPNSLQKASYTDTISFVGSLYTEKSRYNRVEKSLTDYAKGFCMALMNVQMHLYGCDLLESTLTPAIIEEIKQADPDFYHPMDSFTDPDGFVVANEYLCFKLAEIERIQTLNQLADYFQVSLYTRSNTDRLRNVQVKGGVKTLTEMPLVFANSSINLNMTMRSIKTGLPLRIYDIMGCGGFLMTNYQAELPEYFEIGKDLEAYGSMDELLDKCNYYLQHEEERARIARSGYEKVKQFHTYEQRVQKMIFEVGKCL